MGILTEESTRNFSHPYSGWGDGGEGQLLTLLHSERPKLQTILAFLSAIGLKEFVPLEAKCKIFPLREDYIPELPHPEKQTGIYACYYSTLISEKRQGPFIRAGVFIRINMVFPLWSDSLAFLRWLRRLFRFSRSI